MQGDAERFPTEAELMGGGAERFGDAAELMEEDAERCNWEPVPLDGGEVGYYNNDSIEL